jgi:hypothetical protein
MDAPSSSSSDADRSFRRFLDRALGAIENEVPAVHRALCSSLSHSTIRLCVDHERMIITEERGRLLLKDDVRGPLVEFAIDSATLLALTSGESSFLDAALDDRMMVKGAVDEIVLFYDALVLFLQAAVRSPSLPWLLDEFEGSRREIPIHGSEPR